MKRADILLRIIELVKQNRVNGKLNLFSDELPDYKIERLLFIRCGKLYYCNTQISTSNIWCTTYHERDIRKSKLAAILYEIGDEEDRSSVVNDVELQDYEYINNRLGIQFKKK